MFGAWVHGKTVIGSQPLRRQGGPRATLCAVPSVAASGRSDRRRRVVHDPTPPDASVLLASPGQLLSPRRCGLPFRRTGWLPFGNMCRNQARTNVVSSDSPPVSAITGHAGNKSPISTITGKATNHRFSQTNQASASDRAGSNWD